MLPSYGGRLGSVRAADSLFELRGHRAPSGARLRGPCGSRSNQGIRPTGLWSPVSGSPPAAISAHVCSYASAGRSSCSISILWLGLLLRRDRQKKKQKQKQNPIHRRPASRPVQLTEILTRLARISRNVKLRPYILRKSWWGGVVRF